MCARHAADGMDQSAERVAQTMPVEETPCTTAAARRRLLRGPQRPGGARRVTHGAGAGGAAARGVGSARLRDRLATRIIII